MMKNDTLQRAAADLAERVTHHLSPADQLRRLHRIRRRQPFLAFAGAAAAAVLAIGLPMLAFLWAGNGASDLGDAAAPVTTATPSPTTTTAPTETTAPPPPTTPIAAFVGVVLLDGGATIQQFGQPSLAFDSEGNAQVIYRSGDVVGLATCTDTRCSSVLIDEISSPGGGWLAGRPRSDTGPVFWIGGGGDFMPRGSLVVCPDRACTEPISIPLESEWGGAAAVAVDESGKIVAMTGTSIVGCSDASCSDYSAVPVVWETRPDPWEDHFIPALVLRDGLPVMAYRLLGPEGADILFATCAEPDCTPKPEGSGVKIVASLPVPDAVMGPLLTLGPEGEPIALVQIDRTDPADTTWSGALAVIACTDAMCSDWVITELADVGDPYSQWSMATGPDGRARMAWTDHDSLFLATCENGTCSRFSIADIGHPADDISLAFDATGAPVIATMSRDRGLEIVFCGDDACDLSGDPVG